MEGYELNWDSMIENDGEEYTLLDEGDYQYEVTNFERARSSGSGKLPACNMAVITMRISDPVSGTGTTISDNIILHSSLEWKIAQFFRSIGMKKHGEPLRPQWSKLVGCKGRCHVYVDEFTGRDGTPKKNNKIGKYLDPDNQVAPVQTAPTNNFWG